MGTKLLVLSQVFPRFPGDASAKYLQFQCRLLREHGVDPFVVAPHDSGAPEREVFQDIPVVRARYADRDADETLAYRGRLQRALRSPAGVVALRRLLAAMAAAADDVIRREGIQVVSGNWVLPTGLVMSRIRREHPLPMLMTSHGTDVAMLTRLGPLGYWPLRSFCRSLRRWTTVSRFLRERLVTLDRALDPIVEVLPLPHDTSIFRNTNSEREPGLVVSVTRYTRQKRIDQLLAAFAEVSRANPPTRLVIFAQEKPPASVSATLARLALGPGRVTLRDVASQEEISALYNRADVVVLNSVDEGFGLALSEAMLCGATVIGTDSGGIPDIVEHETTGLLVPADDPAALAAALARLLRDADLRAELGTRGHAEALRAYDPNALGLRWAEIVKEAAA